VIPLPTELTTPPVTKMYFGIWENQTIKTKESQIFLRELARVSNGNFTTGVIQWELRSSI